MKRRQFVQNLAVGAGLVMAKPLVARADSTTGDSPGFDAVEATAKDGPAPHDLPLADGPKLLPSGQVLAPGVDERRANAAAPAWLFAPLTLGGVVAEGWRLTAVSPVAYGGFYVELATLTGGRARVTCCRVGRRGAVGVAHSEKLDLLLANAGYGCTATDESLGAAMTALAELARANEDSRLDGLQLLDFETRTTRFGPGVIL